MFAFDHCALGTYWAPLQYMREDSANTRQFCINFYPLSFEIMFNETCTIHITCVIAFSTDVSAPCVTSKLKKD